MVSCCQKPDRKDVNGKMEQKQPETRRVKNLNRATDTLSVILVQEVRDINTRQRAARKENADVGTMKSIKEATAVLKDLTTVSRTLSEGESGADKQGGGVILMPQAEGEV